MANLFRSSKGNRWWPDADATNAPDGALLRADNLVPDNEAQLSLRAGSSKVYEGLLNEVHTLYTRILKNQTFRFAAAENRLYRNGEDFGVTFDGSGDVARGDDSYQSFFARGTVKKKFDGLNFNNWPVAAPEFPATLVAVPAITATVANFDTTESPAFIINEGTSAFVAGYDGTVNGALKLTPNATTGRATASKTFVSDQDFLNIIGSQGGDTDLFDCYVWIEEPTKVDKITFMFGMGTGADPFRDDYYYFDFSIRDPGTVDVKDASSAAAAAYSIIADRTQSVLTPNEITEVKSPEQVVSILKRLGRFAGPRSRERKDPQQNSPAWTHFSVTRGQFNRVGGTAGRNWETIRGFKVVYTALAGSTTVVQFDSAVLTGGGNRSLTGKFRLGYRFVRNFEDHYFELSPISPISDTIELTQQALQATIPAQSLASKDPQVNEIWVYLNGGFLDTYYRFAVIGATIRQGMTIDELTNPAGSNFNTAGERTRLTAWGFTKILGDSTVADLVFTIRKSELEALIENEVLEPGCVGPPDNAIAIVGPFNNRMFILTTEGRLYPSSQDNPSSYSLYHHLDLRRYGDPLWGVMTSGGIFIGMTKDIIRIAGTGDESEDHISVDLFPEAMHVGNPPYDESVVTDGNSILYRSIDGPMLLSGGALSPVPAVGTELLWREQNRHGVEALNIKHGRFRFAIDNHILFMLAPEGVPSIPTEEAEVVDWSILLGGSVSTEGIVTKTDAFDATARKKLQSGDGYLEFTSLGSVLTGGYAGLTFGSLSHGNFSQVTYVMFFDHSGIVTLYQSGNLLLTGVTHQHGDVFRIEILNGVVLYKKNGGILLTSTIVPSYPLNIDLALSAINDSIGPVNIFGDWETVKSSSVIWRYSLVKQQWSRTIYPVNFMSFFRDPDGSLLAGTDGGEVWELEVGTQDDGEQIPIQLLTPINDGGSSLIRKDPLDLQLHVNTGGREGTVDFYLDGSPDVTDSFVFSSPANGPGVHRTDVHGLGVFLRAQMRLTGTFSKFLLHAFNLLFRERVQEVMVLDTGTISPQGTNTMVWLTEVEIDCISPVDLLLDLYLDDALVWTSDSIAVLPNRRSAYRIQLPRGSKARAPRMVFRTTNSAGSDDPGFEPYRVRVRDRGTGTATESNMRPIWPVGTAP